MSADFFDGKWCRSCKKTHGYMSLGVAYEMRGEAFVMRWLCPVHGHDVGELWLGESDAGNDTPSA